MKTKEQLLEHYAKHERPKSFIQIDVFCFEKNARDDVLRPDEDGFALCKLSTQELMSGVSAVRILIRPDVEKRDVLKSLEKAKDSVLRDETYETFAEELIVEESRCRKIQNNFKKLQQILAENNLNLQDARAALNFGVEEPEPEDSIFNGL